MIAFAIAFVVVLFFLNNRDLFERKIKTDNGLTYQGNDILADLVGRDTDGDGISDWEESLWGTDPTKKDTDLNGVSDGDEIAELKRQAGMTGGENESQSDLSQTDKFSRELFATVATLNQGGKLDEVTVDKLAQSLAEQIANAPVKKVYVTSEIKVTSDNSLFRMKKYNEETTALAKKTDIKVNPVYILQSAIKVEGEIDTAGLSKLDPVIENLKASVSGLLAIEVPTTLAPAHLDLINSLQKLMENLSDIKNFDTDALLALSALSQYEVNSEILQEAVNKFNTVLSEKLTS